VLLLVALALECKQHRIFMRPNRLKPGADSVHTRRLHGGFFAKARSGKQFFTPVTRLKL